MTLGANENYDIRIDNLDGDFTASVVEKFLFWSPDLFGTIYNIDTQGVPHRHGGIAVGDGMKKSKVVTLEGMYTGLIGNANDKYGGAHIQKVEQLFEELDLNADTDTFIDIENRIGAATSATRRLFAKILRHKYIPSEGSQYTAGKIRLSFEASDPEFYDDTVKQATGNGSSHSQILVPILGTRPSQRFTVKIANTDGNNLINPTLTEATDSGTWTVTETISGVGDYILVDHLNGTVIKNVSGTDTDIIDKFSGSFFPLPAVSPICTLSVNGAGTGVFTGTIDYWIKAGYAIA